MKYASLVLNLMFFSFRLNIALMTVVEKLTFMCQHFNFFLNRKYKHNKILLYEYMLQVMFVLLCGKTWCFLTKMCVLGVCIYIWIYIYISTLMMISLGTFVFEVLSSCYC